MGVGEEHKLTESGINIPPNIITPRVRREKIKNSIHHMWRKEEIKNKGILSSFRSWEFRGVE